MTKQTTIDLPLLESLLANAECYLMELDYWYDLAEDGDGGSVNRASSTVYYEFEGVDDRSYDRALKEFSEDITELKTIIRDAKAVVRKEDK